jgi:glyoxylase-like metal-dependent hydrolase (beta-lactamase superfamily II)
MNIESELIVEQIAIGPMQNFAYLLGSRRTREVVLVDPAWDIGALLDRVDAQNYILKGALVTHYHPDHIGGSFGSNTVAGLPELLAQNPVRIYANTLEADGVKKVTGVSETDLVRVGSGDTLKIGDIEIEFLHTPGHTPGSQCFRVKNTLVSGDTLFINGCGRVDLPGSNKDDMYHSMAKLRALPDDTLLLPGHHYGHLPSATMADTKKQNPYLQVTDLDTWRQII